MTMISTREEQIFEEMAAQFFAESRPRQSRLSMVTRHRRTILATIWAISLYGAIAMTDHASAAIACLISLVAATAAIVVDATTIA